MGGKSSAADRTTRRQRSENLKIAHVVSYLSPDGSFGGPTRVALAQAATLAQRGHDVTVFAASPPALAGSTQREGFRLRTFAARRLAPFGWGGFASLSSAPLAAALIREAGAFDVAHVHLARDLVTLPGALAIRRAGTPYVLQPHGMIDPSKRALVGPLDAVATRPVLRDAASVLALTEVEMAAIAQVEPKARLSRIMNGIPESELPPYHDREDIVLFLARLHRRKRPVEFVRMAELLSDLDNVQFILAGPDEGEAAAVREAIAASGLSGRVQWVGSVTPEETDSWFRRARAYVLPSVDEVFPMTILEAMRMGAPVVTTTSLGIADWCIAYGAAAVTDGSAVQLAGEVRQIWTDGSRAEFLRRGGARLLSSEMSMDSVATVLERAYSRQPTRGEAR